jgi:hypothetical protein
MPINQRPLSNQSCPALRAGLRPAARLTARGVPTKKGVKPERKGCNEELLWCQDQIGNDGFIKNHKKEGGESLSDVGGLVHRLSPINYTAIADI